MARGEYDRTTDHLKQVLQLLLDHAGGLAAAKFDESWTVLLFFVELWIKQQRYSKAAALLGFMQPRLHDAHRRDVSERLLAELREHFSTEELEQALAEGEQMSLATAVQSCL